MELTLKINETTALAPNLCGPFLDGPQLATGKLKIFCSQLDKVSVLVWQLMVIFIINFYFLSTGMLESLSLATMKKEARFFRSMCYI